MASGFPGQSRTLRGLALRDTTPRYQDDEKGLRLRRAPDIAATRLEGQSSQGKKDEIIPFSATGDGSSALGEISHRMHRIASSLPGPGEQKSAFESRKIRWFC